MTAKATATARAAALGFTLLASVAGCGGRSSGASGEASGGANRGLRAQATPQQAASDASAAVEHVEISRSTHTLAPEPLDGSTDEATVAGDDESLVGEEVERDPRSDTVKIRVIVDARRQAHVTWGRKDFGVAPLEIERPRNSGPLDLVVVAPGYLPLHARALTDRDDVLSLRLYAPAEASQLLGYRAEAAPAHDGETAAPNSPQNKGENRRDAKASAGARADFNPGNGNAGNRKTGNRKTGDEKNRATRSPQISTAKKQPK